MRQAAAPWGFNFFAHSSKLCNDGKGCDAVNVVGECAASGGPKWITAEAAYYAGDKNRHGKTWHPPAGMHLLRGEVLAYNYVQIIADAVFTVENDLKSKTPAEASKGTVLAHPFVRVMIATAIRCRAHSSLCW
jgi:hypothetical protein